MTHGAGISPPDRRRGNRQRLRALLLLLAMCLAVLPHVTLAASAMQGPAADSHRHEVRPHGAAIATARAAGEAEPCHQPRQSCEHPAAMPACCIVGCGLIAEVPAIVLPARAILWSHAAPAAAEPLAGISPEPAKPPPRAASLRS